MLFEPLDPPEDVMMIDVPLKPNQLLWSIRIGQTTSFTEGRFSPEARWVAFTADP